MELRAIDRIAEWLAISNGNPWDRVVQAQLHFMLGSKFTVQQLERADAEFSAGNAVLTTQPTAVAARWLADQASPLLRNVLETVAAIVLADDETD